MPGTCCAVYGCKNTYKKRQEENEEFIFHRFPKVRDLLSQRIRKEWIFRTKRKDKFNPDTSYMCSVHFTKNDYERDLRNELLGLPLRNILKKTAVPTLALYEKKMLGKAHISNSHSRGERLAKRRAKQEVNKLLERATLPVNSGNSKESNVNVTDLREEDTQEKKTDVESTVAEPNTLQHKQSSPKKRLKVELDNSQPSDEWKDLIFVNDEDTQEGEFRLERPLGDQIFRVCRTCSKIMNTQDAIPLAITGDEKEIELYNKLRSVLQLDFFPMDNSCLCRQCKDFINAVYDFKTTCRLNEDVLREFDWTNKTKDLLHVVDQEELKKKYDQTVNSLNSCGTKMHIQETIEDTNLENLSEKGNGLSDMEDHWYDDEKSDCKVDHNYAVNNEPVENIFSSEFDKYFKKISGPVTSRLKKKCRKYHVKDGGKGPFLCDICGKVKLSRSAYRKHLKLHQCSTGFNCSECNKMFSEWSPYINHCKIQHGGIPKTFECQLCFKKYSYKKYFDSHLKAHRKCTCLKCGKVFNNNRALKKHSDCHKRILYKICGKGSKGKSFHRQIQLGHSIRNPINGSQKIFKCNLCEKRYLKFGSLKLHEKMCHVHVNDVEISQS